MATISTFEVFPNEIILHIYQYLRNVDILYSFFNLNTRFNMIINEFCHYLNLNGVIYKQFDWILSNILSQIGSNIQSFVINGNWISFLLNRIYSIHFDSNISLIFPNLHVLILEYFTGEQLLTFLDKIKGFSKLVQLHIKCLMDRRSDELLRKILGTNNNRLRIVTFDYNSIFLSLTKINRKISFSNIEELTVNLIDCGMLENLFVLVPNVRRLHINFGASPFVSTTKLQNVLPLIHLNDLQLRSIDMTWTLENLVDILNKTPSLMKLAFYLTTDDKRLFNKQNLDIVLPSSLVQIDFFIFYYYSELDIEIDTLVATWPSGHISISCLTDEPYKYAIIHTIPFNFTTIIIPSTIGKHMLPGWKHMQKVENLKIFGEASSIDVLMTIQHFHRIRMLEFDLETDQESSTTIQIPEQIVLHLPRLKQLKIIGTCELLPLFKAAPNLNNLSIDFHCYNRIINDESICQLLKKRIVRLEIFQLQDNQMVQLNMIIQQFPNLRHIILYRNDSSVFIDSLILQAFELWREEQLTYLCINGSLSGSINQKLRQWFIDHNNLQIKDSFVIDYENKYFHLWF